MLDVHDAEKKAVLNLINSRRSFFPFLKNSKYDVKETKIM